jgi:predicted secreted hydrolase
VVKNLCVLTVICLTSALVLAQSDIAGKWISEEPSAGGAVVVLQLSVKGAVVSGTITIGESPTQAIADGKFDRNSVSFKTTSILNGKEVPVTWEGSIADKNLTLLRSFGTSGRKLPPIVMKRSQ